MIAYMCKYAPIEILEAFDTPVVMMEPHVTNFTQADTLMHPNMCSFVKAVLEEFVSAGYEGMLFTTCCDSSRRLYDALKRLFPEKFFFCIDLPRKVNDFSISMYVQQMEELIRAYAAFSGKMFEPEKLEEMCSREFDMQARKKELVEAGLLPKKEADIRVCLAGARPGSEIKKLIEDLGAEIALDLTCTGVMRKFAVDRDEILQSYAKSLLTQIPCMRMSRVEERRRKLEEMAGELDGIIYHTVKFCDIYSYEYAGMKEGGVLPMVKLEADATSQCAGQILTRVEAFLESLRARKAHAVRTGLQGDEEMPSGEPCRACCPDGCADFPGQGRLSREEVARDAAILQEIRLGADTGRRAYSGKFDGNEDSGRVCPGECDKNDPGGRVNPGGCERNENGGSTYTDGCVGNEKKENTPMYVMGIDSGSTSTNAVIINEKKEIVSWAVVRTGAKSGESAEKILQEVLKKAGMPREAVSLIVSTGYGRVSIPFADRNVTEISCHGKGAHFLNPAVRTILDIGGQDSKAIRLNEQGDVVDFVMNDKCAAGTGRFLEMMARTLEIGIDELGPVSLQSEENVEISSMCSVFAESEVISLIAQNKETADIAHGIHRAIAGKALSLLKRVGLEKEFMMTGGVAKNPGVVKVLEEMLGAPLYIYEQPEIVGALGAALYGLESCTAQ
ncbi:MAG: acyl-CoA dehydratase activase [Clostridiales bacterium]|nr:acyl-CoA dehydratase activase [Clostridiales bacterium]